MRGRPPIDLQIVEFDWGEGAVEAYFYAEGDVAGVAIDYDLPEFAKRAREIEAHAYNTKRPPKGGRRFCLANPRVEDIDPQALLAIRSVIEDLAPTWVDEVKDACRISNDPRVIAAWCELSLQVVVAITENLEARGELPEEGPA